MIDKDFLTHRLSVIENTIQEKNAQFQQLAAHLNILQGHKDEVLSHLEALKQPALPEKLPDDKPKSSRKKS